MSTVPTTVTTVIADLVGRMSEIVSPIAVYAGGSLATGDYQPAVSDLDLIAVLPARPDRLLTGRLKSMHRELRRQYLEAAKLHCQYVTAESYQTRARFPMWDGSRMSSRLFTGVARMELQRGGICFLGPPAVVTLPAVSADDLHLAVRAELTGYWTVAIGWRWAWWKDSFVDLGLITLPRARAALTDGRLITKREAIEQLSDFGVPADLVVLLRQRRAGQRTRLGVRARARRAQLARTLMAAGIDDLVT